MPHLVLAGHIHWESVVEGLGPRLERRDRAVLKIEEWWLRVANPGLLASGVVVEFARPLHPVAVVVPRDADTVVRLWSLAPVERTETVQRWLALVASELQQHGAGPLRSTNIAAEMVAEMGVRC